MGHFLSNQRTRTGLLTPPQLANQFARSWAASELQQLRQGHWNRTATVTTLFTLECVILLAGATYLLDGPHAAAIAAVTAVLLTPPLVVTLLVAIEAHQFRTALRTWFRQSIHGRTGAYITTKGKDADWWLYCVHASPTGRGLGTELLARVCAAADQEGVTLMLDSSGADATRFYWRHGFVPAQGGRRRMCRLPKCQDTQLA